MYHMVQVYWPIEPGYTVRSDLFIFCYYWTVSVQLYSSIGWIILSKKIGFVYSGQLYYRFVSLKILIYRIRGMNIQSNWLLYLDRALNFQLNSIFISYLFYYGPVFQIDQFFIVPCHHHVTMQWLPESKHKVICYLLDQIPFCIVITLHHILQGCLICPCINDWSSIS